MRTALATIGLAAALLTPLTPLSAACCYFAALGKDINQPGQKAFITWDEDKHAETFTVQPTFQGNATDFGMVIPTPTRPRLAEMPRDFFKALAIFTILEPMDVSKYKNLNIYKTMRMEDAAGMPPGRHSSVRVLEAGIVGSLDYKILEADRADDLFDWLKSNRYTYAGDTATLDFYIRKKWDFTVMKIDPRQMKKNPDGSYTGDVTPTRFSFSSDHLTYPLHITQISVPTHTDALFYVLSKHKVDLPDQWSYEPNFLSMWSQALGYALPDKVTPKEHMWQATISKLQPQPNTVGGTLEWAGVLDDKQMGFIDGSRSYDRDAPPEEAKKLALLKGHLQRGLYLTKFRKQFDKAEMTHDLDLVPATILGLQDDIDYTQILPTSPP
ncbi:MAG TPA: DUF2330 domain-containing protein [Candidatus Xenobia bacterium]|jgi:hypothetical protein